MSYFRWPTDSTTQTQSFNASTHPGIDIAPVTADVTGDNIYAIADGIVEKTFPWSEGDSIDGNGSMGICIYIKHDKAQSGDRNKYIRSIYMHLNETPTVSEGDSVSRGDVIGKMGHTGEVYSSTGGNGTHLHFAVKENSTAFTNGAYATGTFVNPFTYQYTTA